MALAAASMMAFVAIGQTGFQLEWTAPSDCPQREAIEASIERKLGRHPTEPFLARGVMSMTPAGFRLDLETVAPEWRGHRALESPSCAELAEAAALMLALTLEPNLVVPEVTEPKPQAVSPEPVAREQESSWSLDVGANAAMDIGMLPSAAPGALATLGLQYGWLRVELRGGAFLPQRVPISFSAAAAATLAIDFELGARGCWAFRGDLLTPMGCLGFGVGQASGRGEGVSSPASSRVIFGAAFAGAGLRLKLFGPVYLRGVAELGLCFARPSFYFVGEPSVHQSSLVLGRGELGVEVRFR